MLHHLTIGASLSGKTTLNRLFARGMKRRGIFVAVLDPIRDPLWPCDFLTADPHAFHRFLLTRRSTRERWRVFIDEGALSLDRATAFDWLTRTGRHLGFITHLVSHRFRDLTPGIRQGCLCRWIFHHDEGAAMSREWGKAELADADKLRPGEFLLSRPWSNVHKGTLRGFGVGVGDEKISVVLKPLPTPAEK